MIEEYVAGVAAQMGMKMPKVWLVDGLLLGCRDAYLLNISTQGRIASAIIFKTDFVNLNKGKDCDQLELKIRLALSRLQRLLAPRP